MEKIITPNELTGQETHEFFNLFPLISLVNFYILKAKVESADMIKISKSDHSIGFCIGRGNKYHCNFINKKVEQKEFDELIEELRKIWPRRVIEDKDNKKEYILYL